MKLISLSGKRAQGRFVKVDDEDYEHLSAFSWHINLSKKNGATFEYAARGTYRDGRKHIVLMHRDIMSCGRGFVVDHRNHDTFDNQKSNLRVCTQPLNMTNRALQSNNTSGFQGVYFHKATSKWAADIRHQGKKRFIGTFPSAVEAARARDVVARQMFGEFAAQNFAA